MFATSGITSFLSQSDACNKLTTLYYFPFFPLINTNDMNSFLKPPEILPRILQLPFRRSFPVVLKSDDIACINHSRDMKQNERYAS